MRISAYNGNFWCPGARYKSSTCGGGELSIEFINSNSPNFHWPALFTNTDQMQTLLWQSFASKFKNFKPSWNINL